MRTAVSCAIIVLGLTLTGCGKEEPMADVPPSVKNEQPIPGSDQQLSESAARAKAMGQERQQQQGK